MPLKEILVSAFELLIGLSAGGAAAAGVFAIITVIGIIPRWAARSRTDLYLRQYEWGIILGGTAGNILYLMQPDLAFLPETAAKAAETAVGIFTGVYAGGLIMSLAEVINVFPVMLRRGRIQVGIPWMVASIAAGKALGAWLFFSGL